jgi:UDP-glucose:glycoprotein glucosyltransferase
VKTLRDKKLLAGSDSLATFALAASIHAAAPRIQAHYQYYKTSIEPLLPAAQDAVCPVWVYLEGKQYCSPTLERAQQDFPAPE